MRILMILKLLDGEEDMKQDAHYCFQRTGRRTPKGLKKLILKQLGEGEKK